MSSILTVTQINRYISYKMKEDRNLRGILVSGEISNFVLHTKSGHMYFTLKDSESSIKSVMFSSMASRLRFAPANGMKVIVSANVQVYERDGVYQLYVSDIQPDGIGALYLEFEQLKEKLAMEGIFDGSHKKPLPAMPENIGIITSPEAAALQDMLNILSRRYPVAKVTVFPALVQGVNAPASLCRAIKYADSRKLDLLICGRGGGSLEELMAFNNESVARCIYSCETPVISAVGHETDTSISDFAADLRAPTPSAAAELAVPDMSVISGRLSDIEKALRNGISGRLDGSFHKLDILSKRIEAASPAGKLRSASEKLKNYEKRIDDLYKIDLQKAGAAIAEKAARLDALSPLKTLSRGYSLVYRDGRLINSAKELSAGDDVEIRLADGTVSALIQ